MNRAPTHQMQMQIHKKKKTESIILWQTPKTRHRITTLEIRLIRQFRHKPALPSLLITPLRRGLCLPRPIKPAHHLLKGIHLCFGIGLEKFLVVVRIRRDGGVGVVAAAGLGFVAVARCGRAARVGRRAYVASPACAGADVVEVFGAVGVGLGEFAVDGWAPAVLFS